MNKHRKRAISPFCSKLVLTIGFLICVPMLLIQILLFVSSYSTLHRQNDQYYYLKTQSLSSRFSAQLAGFRKIALKISSASYTSSLKKFESDPSPYRMLKISEELKAIADTNYLASGVGIYYPRQDVALNSSVYYTLDTLCIRLGENDPAVRQRVEAALSAPYSGGTSLVFFPSNSARTGRMLITLPVKLNRYDDYDAVVYFVVDQSDMATALSGDAPSENSLCAIFSQEGELLYASGRTDLFAQEEFQAYLADPSQMSRTFSEETAYKWQDSGSPYLFVTLVGKSELEENARAFFQRMGILLLINVVTVAAMICLTAYINYSPLRRLVSRVGAPGQGGSEFDQLEQIIRDLDSRAADQGVVIMDYVLNDLLYGMPVNQPELERLIPNFHFRYFCAVSVTCRPPSPVQSEQISRRIEEGTGCRSYITDMPHKDHTLFVCLSQKDMDTAALGNAISAAVAEVLGETCSVFPGTVVERLEDISASFTSSQAQLGGEDGSAGSREYPSAQLALLENQLSGGRMDAARELLDEIFGYIEENRHDRSLARYLCYETLNVCLSARKRSPCPVGDQEMQELLRFKDPEDLHRMLKQSLSAWKQEPAGPGKEGSRQQEEIVAYVDQNFQRPELSLLTVADQFGISIYMVSRLFKNQTGAGFKEYITARRLEQAARLLLGTRDSVSSIAAQVGFESPAYFTSLFRARYGKTPSRYRDDGN